ncbi:MAG: hypothetical protein RR413_10100 [Christensenellaceae bacterium]
MKFRIGFCLEYRCRFCEIIKRYTNRILLQCDDIKVVTTDQNTVRDIKIKAHKNAVAWCDNQYYFDWNLVPKNFDYLVELKSKTPYKRNPYK